MYNKYHGITRDIPVPLAHGATSIQLCRCRRKTQDAQSKVQHRSLMPSTCRRDASCQGGPPLSFEQRKELTFFFYFIPVLSSPSPPTPPLPPGRKIPPGGKHCRNLFWFLVKCKSLLGEVIFFWGGRGFFFLFFPLEILLQFLLLNMPRRKTCFSTAGLRCQAAHRNVGLDTCKLIWQEMSSSCNSHSISGCSIPASHKEGKKEHYGSEEQAAMWSWAGS